MTASYATVDGLRITQLIATFPLRGCPLIDAFVERDLPSALGVKTFVIGPLVVRASIFRSGDFVGSGSLRAVGGAGGWKEVIPERGYRSPFGVSLRTILTDAAKEAGEAIVVQAGAERKVGPFYARARGPAEHVLGQLAGLWWVRPDGVTEVGERAATPIATPFDVLREGTRPNAGVYAVATDSPEDWMPGRTFSSPMFSGQKTISASVVRLEKGKLRVEAWASP